MIIGLMTIGQDFRRWITRSMIYRVNYSSGNIRSSNGPDPTTNRLKGSEP